MVFIMNKFKTEILGLGWIDDSIVSKKRWFVLAILCIYGGVFGLHRFYAGKIRSGFMMLVTLGGLGVWAVVDLVSIFLGEFCDMSGKYIRM